jgi:PPOX class probable F420-dependent enzyme
VSLQPEVRELIEGRNFAHLATLMADGAPHSVTVWIGMEDDRPVFFTQPLSLKARNLARDPRVAVSLVDHANPYRTGQLRGAVAATREGDEALAVIDRLSQKYTREDFPMRSGIVYEIEVEWSRFMELPFQH